MEQIGLHDYTIYIGEAWTELEKIVHSGKYSQFYVLVDTMTKNHCLPILQQELQAKPAGVIEIPSGEIHKNLKSCQIVWDKLFEQDADRKALILNLGGGVIGDLGGFAASTYKRGIPFIQIPTTLLSQLDASIGGKMGIDYAQFKNSIGVFQNPEAVFVNPVFYDTLPDRQLKSGYGEALKHALIADKEMWDQIKSIRDLRTIDWEEFLEKSISIKRKIVEMDPTELGPRKALNFGHTIGHAVESVLLDSDTPLLHGEAIILGMIAESRIAEDRGWLSSEELEDIVTHLIGYVDFDFRLTDRDEIYKLMLGDKKNEEGRILCTFLNGIGQFVVNQEISREEMESSLNYLEEQFDFTNV